MCIFTGEVEHVSSTRIFARLQGQKQAVIYDMYLSTDDETAMVLPIPTAQGNIENIVEFIDLSGYSDVFEDLHDLFPKSRGIGLAVPAGGSGILEVTQVGAFSASFVPSPSEFSRLDPRFQLSKIVIEALPKYADYGFVVFKLQKGALQVHPMAFWFKTREESQLYYPTVHVHDGSVYNTEEFDHALYAQGSLSEHIDLESTYKKTGSKELQTIESKSMRIISSNFEVYKKILTGSLPNKDVWLNFNLP